MLPATTPETDLGMLRASLSGLSAARLAKLLGMTPERLRRLEHGRAKATRAEVRLLARALDIQWQSVPVKRKEE